MLKVEISQKRRPFEGQKRKRQSDFASFQWVRVPGQLLFSVVSGAIIKAIYWDGTGLWLLAKKLETGRFVWPPIVDGAMTLTPAQMTLLVEAMDWRRTVAPEPPQRCPPA